MKLLLITNTIKENWEESKFIHMAEGGHYVYSLFAVNVPILRMVYIICLWIVNCDLALETIYGIRKIVTVISLHVRVLLAKCTPY